MWTTIFKLTGFVIIINLVGCANIRLPVTTIQPISLDTSNVVPAVDYGELSSILTRESFIDPDSKYLLLGSTAEISNQLQPLLKRLAVTGPTVTPKLFASRSDRLAYWYNARVAWSLYLVRQSCVDNKVDMARFAGTRFPLDGRPMTLADIDSTLRKSFTWQAAAVAPSLRTDRLVLPKLAFSADKVDEAVVKRLSEYVDDSQRFKIDIARQQISVPEAIWLHRDEIISDYERSYGTKGANLLTALLSHVSGSAHRRLQDAVGYRVVKAKPGRINCAKSDED